MTRGETVASIIRQVRRGGDVALRRLTARFDGARRRRIELSPAEWRAARRQVSRDTMAALRMAASRIARFARAQKRSLRPVTLASDGVRLEQRLLPIERVGLYVPAGRHPLCSTVLMGAIPARVAGCSDIILCTPPRRDGSIAPEILAAARLAGVDRIFAIGGAQAIAAMAHGTRSIPRVDLIAGPGNAWVAEAKAQVAGIVGIDFVAGPTELLLIADDTTDPGLAASDLLGQAEHDPEARLWLLSLSARAASRIRRELARQLAALPSGSPSAQAARAAVRRMVTKRCVSLRAACAAANHIAPEHLSVQTHAPRRAAALLRSYGSLFLGPGSAVALGDYITGPNHVLPTAGAARHTGGLSVLRFMKAVTVQQVSPRGAHRLAAPARKLASLEGLRAHEESIRLRALTARERLHTVLFDFNGVLVDDEQFHYRSFLDALAPHGVRFSRATYDARYLAFDDFGAARAIMKDHGVRTDIAQLVARKRRAYIRLCGPSFGIEPGIVGLVKQLRAGGARLAIVSGAARVEIEAVLRRARLRRHFDIVIAAEDVRRCKPSPEGYRRALRLLKAKPADCLAIEDSPGGIAAARAAGLRVLGVTTSYPSRTLRRAGAARVVASLSRMQVEELLA